MIVKVVSHWHGQLFEAGGAAQTLVLLANTTKQTQKSGDDDRM
jgi:hypothetical protein